MRYVLVLNRFRIQFDNLLPIALHVLGAWPRSKHSQHIGCCDGPHTSDLLDYRRISLLMLFFEAWNVNLREIEMLLRRLSRRLLAAECGQSCRGSLEPTVPRVLLGTGSVGDGCLRPLVLREYAAPDAFLH